MKTYQELLELAFKKYPFIPGGYFDGEPIDGNEGRRHAYVDGYLDGARYAVDEIKNGRNEKGGE